MRKIFLLPLIILGSTMNGFAGNKPLSPSANPVAKAGPDQTIYLSKTSSVTLNGSGSSGDSYKWTNVSTDQQNNATISSPSSAVTTVTGLEQGTWYYQLSVTSSGNTATDVVIIRVEYDGAPANSTLLRELPIAAMSAVANIRDDTTKYWGDSDPLPRKRTMYTDGDMNVFLQRDREPGMHVDNQKAKFYSTIEDGYGAATGNYGTYARSELHYGTTYTVDSNKTYVFEWKGYFPQSIHDNIANIVGEQYGKVLAIMQWHGGDNVSPPFQINLFRDEITFSEMSVNGNGANTSVQIMPTTDSYIKQSHTIRVTLREGKGYSGQDAFIKVEVDGVQKYFRNKGQVGATFQRDYIKFSGLYDWMRAIVSPSLLSRGKKFSLVTEAFKIYQLTANTVADPSNIAPVADAGDNRKIDASKFSIVLDGSGSDKDGKIASYRWTKKSGPVEGTIMDPSSAQSGFTALVPGIYVLELQVTDDKGATGKSTMQVTVTGSADNIAAVADNAAPLADAGDDRIIYLPKYSIVLAGSASDKDGKISSYLWTKKSGPSSGTIMSPSSARSGLTNLVEGVYQFELKVTDDNGATGKSTMLVTVKNSKSARTASIAGTTKLNDTLPGADDSEMEAIVNTATVAKTKKSNIAPLANAGNDTVVIAPVKYFTLSGKGSDHDGIVNTYLWNQISGPSTTIVSPNTTSTNVTNLIPGSYQFELTVTDDLNETGKDTVNITVGLGKLAPVSNSPAVRNTLKVYPNPVHDITTLEISTKKPNTNLIIIVTDIAGKSVYRKEFVSAQNNIQERINMSNLIKGTYVITVSFDGVARQTTKVARL